MSEEKKVKSQWHDVGWIASWATRHSTNLGPEPFAELLEHITALKQESEAVAVYQVEQVIGGVSYWLDVSKQLYDCETLCKKRTVSTAPQYTQVIETAAIMKCAEVCEKAAHGVAGAGIFAEAVRALIPQDGRTALFDKCTEVAEAVNQADRDRLRWHGNGTIEQLDVLCDTDTSAIVTNLIGVPPLNSEIAVETAMSSKAASVSGEGK